MKAKKKTFLILFIIIAVLVLIEIFAQPFRALLAFGSMKSLETGEVLSNVYAINNSYVNMYLLKSGDAYIAFDAGANMKTTQSDLTALDIKESDITAVFLTHTDYDHVAALPYFSSAAIYMAQSNKVFIEASPGRSKNFVGMEIDYKTLSEGEIVSVADVDIQCIFTPGHTDGSACYIVDGKYLFAGDNFSLKNGKAALFNHVFNMNDEEQGQSIHKLAQLQELDTVVAIFTMHYGYTTDAVAAFAKWQ